VQFTVVRRLLEEFRRSIQNAKWVYRYRNDNQYIS